MRYLNIAQSCCIDARALLLQIVLSWGNLNPLMRLVILKLRVVILEGSFCPKGNI